jgi:hypothetical protein
MYRLKQLTLLVADFCCLYAALYISTVLRYKSFSTTEFFKLASPLTSLYLAAVIIMFIVGLYDVTQAKNRILFYKRIIISSAIWFTIGIFYFYLSPSVSVAPKTILALTTVTGFGLIALWRYIYNRFLSSMIWKSTVLFVGQTTETEALIKPNIKGQVTRGQYREYESEVGHKSTTETFVALKTFVNNKRWKGVPFYLRTGKRLGEKLTQISIYFKKRSPLFGFNRSGNVLTFRIQPDESVQVRINNKIPGFGIKLHAGTLDFGYKTAFLTEIPPAYERLFLDFMQGDQRLFLSREEIEAAWKFADSLIQNWNAKNAPLKKYESGTNWPKQ